MARFEFKLPDIGEGVAEGEVVSWLVKVGDKVVEDAPMVEVMTDKATVTIGAPKAGTIAELRGNVGQVVKVGAVLVVIDMSGAGAAASVPAAAHAPAQPAPAASVAAKSATSDSSSGPAATAVGDIRESLPGTAFFTKSPAKPVAVAQTNGNGGHAGNGVHAAAPAMVSNYFAEKPLATPATRKLARDLGVDLKRVPPTGSGGRVTKTDVNAFATGSTATSAGAHAPASGSPTEVLMRAPNVGRDLIAIRAPGAEAAALEDRKPFVGMRRKIAEKMQIAKNTAAHFTFVEECDVGPLKDMQTRLRASAEKQGTKLTLLPFITKAVVAALKKHPILNSALDESTNELVYRRYYNVGIAAATDQGLMVPVVKNADRLSLLGIAKEIDRLGTGAKAGTLTSAELSGSTFTITSLGKQGGLFATPVLNFPEVGILGVHQIKQRPVVKNGQIVIGEVMLLSLSFDHRIVDGHVGAAFAYDIIGYLEDPDRLFLEMT